MFSREIIIMVWGNMLDVDSMKEAAAFLTGTHDFKSFCGNKEDEKNNGADYYRYRVQAAGKPSAHLFYRKWIPAADGAHSYRHADRSGDGKM